MTRSKQDLIDSQFVELNEWQLAEIQAALVEAGEGDFASEGELAEVQDKWKVNAR